MCCALSAPVCNHCCPVPDSKKHPDATTGPPQKPRSPVWYYRHKHPELSVKQARAAMAAMSSEERCRYIRRAQRALHRYEKAVEAYQVRVTSCWRGGSGVDCLPSWGVYRS